MKHVGQPLREKWLINLADGQDRLPRLGGVDAWFGEFAEPKLRDTSVFAATFPDNDSIVRLFIETLLCDNLEVAPTPTAYGTRSLLVLLGNLWCAQSPHEIDRLGRVGSAGVSRRRHFHHPSHVALGHFLSHSHSFFHVSAFMDTVLPPGKKPSSSKKKPAPVKEGKEAKYAEDEDVEMAIPKESKEPEKKKRTKEKVRG